MVVGGHVRGTMAPFVTFASCITSNWLLTLMGPMCPLPSLSLSLSLQMSLTLASLLYIVGLNRSVERAWQTNRHATSCVSGAGAGAAAQYAECISTIRRGPPTLTLPDHGAALQVPPVFTRSLMPTDGRRVFISNFIINLVSSLLGKAEEKTKRWKANEKHLKISLI